MITVIAILAAIGVGTLCIGGTFAASALVDWIKHWRRRRSYVGPAPRTSSKLIAERQAKLVALGPRPPWWRVLSRLRWHRRHAAIMAMDVSAAAEMFRSVYSSARVQELAEQFPPSFAMLKKAGPEVSDSVSEIGNGYRFRSHRSDRERNANQPGSGSFSTPGVGDGAENTSARPGHFVTRHKPVAFDTEDMGPPMPPPRERSHEDAMALAWDESMLDVREAFEREDAARASGVYGTTSERKAAIAPDTDLDQDIETARQVVAVIDRDGLHNLEEQLPDVDTNCALEDLARRVLAQNEAIGDLKRDLERALATYRQPMVTG